MHGWDQSAPLPRVGLPLWGVRAPLWGVRAPLYFNIASQIGCSLSKCMWPCFLFGPLWPWMCPTSLFIKQGNPEQFGGEFLFLCGCGLHVVHHDCARYITFTGTPQPPSQPDLAWLYASRFSIYIPFLRPHHNCLGAVFISWPKFQRWV
jgi:hypothetical protein